ncbi:MAG: spore coat U domain-containing protein [Gammaproteobacteria bacterium]
MKKHVLYALTIASIFGVATAFADTATSTFQVSATVADACSVASSDTLNFGTYNPLDGSVTTGNTDIDVTCTQSTGYNVGLSAGTGSGASVSTRKMTSTTSSDTLEYTLYQDSGYSSVWGETIGSNTYSDDGTGLEQTIPVYGKIAASQNVPAGTYEDTITVTVTY